MPIVSKRFIDTRSGEIVTSILLTQIQYFEEYDGPLQKGDFDARLAGHMTNAGDHASVADAGDTAVTMPAERTMTLAEAVRNLIATRDNALAWNDSEDPDDFDCGNDDAIVLVSDFLTAVALVEQSWSKAPAAPVRYVCNDCGTAASTEAVGTVCTTCRRGIIGRVRG